MTSSQPQTTSPERLYLDLVERVLTRTGFEERYRPIESVGVRRVLVRVVNRALGRAGLEVVRATGPSVRQARAEGRDRPSEAETMIGLRRIESLRECLADVLLREVPGDFLEAGAWRGGATILMRAVLEAYGDRQRQVWVADSFQGLPPPDATAYPADTDDPHWRYSELAVSVDEVRANFEKYGLLDDRVHFLEGWFSDTLVDAPVERLAVLRLDGDMYESTMVALQALYPKVSVGGYVIIDDYGAVDTCRAAVDEFRRRAGIEEPLVEVDWTGRYWRRATETEG